MDILVHVRELERRLEDAGKRCLVDPAVAARLLVVDEADVPTGVVGGVRVHEGLRVRARDERSLFASAAPVCKWGSVEAGGGEGVRTFSDSSVSNTRDAPLAWHSLAASFQERVSAAEKNDSMCSGSL